MGNLQSEIERISREQRHLSEEQKEIIVKGIEFWMDKQFSRFGKWTAFWLLSGLFGYFVLLKIKILGVH